MKMSHKQYLERTLQHKKQELENLKVAFQVASAEYEVKKTLLYEQIDSMEEQLEEGGE